MSLSAQSPARTTYPVGTLAATTNMVASPYKSPSRSRKNSAGITFSSTLPSQSLSRPSRRSSASGWLVGSRSSQSFPPQPLSG
jgi:hypothetical protein